MCLWREGEPGGYSTPNIHARGKRESESRQDRGVGGIVLRLPRLGGLPGVPRIEKARCLVRGAKSPRDLSMAPDLAHGFGAEGPPEHPSV